MSYILPYSDWKKLSEAVTAYDPPDEITVSSSIDNLLDTNLQNLVTAIQSEFGKPLTITSAFRDPQRNKKVGGAGNSAHTRNNAVDITFNPTVEDTIKFVEIASRLGAGGIGVYNKGFVHVDVEGRRAWGEGFTSKGIPDWAREVTQKHVAGDFSDDKKVVPTVDSPNIIKGVPSVGIQAPTVQTVPKEVPAEFSSNQTIVDVLRKMKDVQLGKLLLKKGHSGNEIKLIRLRLQQLGFIPTPSEITGTFDSELETIIRDFQTTAGIKIDGVIGPETFQELYGSEIKKGSKPAASISVQGGKIKSSYTGEKAKNINLLIKEMIAQGVTNPHAQIGMLATIGKESAFIPKAEYSYSNTSNQRLREVFGSRLSQYSEEELSELKKNDVEFFDQIYGYKSKRKWNTGNTEPGDGYKYRGRGFNQITFKSTYKKYGDLLSIDLVANPDHLNDINIAVKAAVLFLLNGLKRMNVDPNSFTDTQSAVRAFVQVNAGLGTNIEGSESYTNAIRVSNSFSIDPSAV